MKVSGLLVAVLALAPGALASGYGTAVLPAAEDVSMPFMCDWGYDEDLDLPGPAFPSSSYADQAQRPRLVVGYMD
jgi:hypothetical protein